MESAPIKVPYKNLKKDVEVEMVGFPEQEQHYHRIHLGSSSSSSPNSIDDPGFSPPIPARSKSNKNVSLIVLILSCTVAAGVQFGWALQLSLLTPYIQACFFIYNWCFSCL